MALVTLTIKHGDGTDERVFEALEKCLAGIVAPALSARLYEEIPREQIVTCRAYENARPGIIEIELMMPRLPTRPMKHVGFGENVLLSIFSSLGRGHRPCIWFTCPPWLARHEEGPELRLLDGGVRVEIPEDIFSAVRIMRPRRPRKRRR